MHDVIVIGGGIAGSCISIQLARAGKKTLLLEKKKYPTDKLCGEFLSTEVQDAFNRLGVLEAVKHLGSHPIRKVLVSAGRVVFEGALPGTALGVSRCVLDKELLEQARLRGVDAHEGVAVRSISGSLSDGFQIHSNTKTFESKVVVGAFGKRDLLDKKLGRSFLKKNEPFLAFKAHFEGGDVADRIELHAFRGGYCGLSGIESGFTNVCWITHQDAFKRAGSKADEMVKNTFVDNPYLADRFGKMHRVTAYQTTSQISFADKGKFDGDVCMVGDTAGMIAPLCGDGMAMAIRSSEIATPLILSFLDGQISGKELKEGYTKAWRSEFKRRLFLGRILHHGFIKPALASLVLSGMRISPAVGRWIIRETRG